MSKVAVGEGVLGSRTLERPRGSVAVGRSAKPVFPLGVRFRAWLYLTLAGMVASNYSATKVNDFLLPLIFILLIVLLALAATIVIAAMIVCASAGGVLDFYFMANPWAVGIWCHRL